MAIQEAEDVDLVVILYWELREGRGVGGLMACGIEHQNPWVQIKSTGLGESEKGDRKLKI